MKRKRSESGEKENEVGPGVIENYKVKRGEKEKK